MLDAQIYKAILEYMYTRLCYTVDEVHLRWECMKNLYTNGVCRVYRSVYTVIKRICQFYVDSHLEWDSYWRKLSNMKIPLKNIYFDWEKNWNRFDETIFITKFKTHSDNVHFQYSSFDYNIINVKFCICESITICFKYQLIVLNSWQLTQRVFLPFKVFTTSAFHLTLN